MTKSLTELANFYGSDKGTIGPSPGWAPHNYTDVYEVYLEPYRNLPIKFLEIGLGVRGSKWDSPMVHGRNVAGGASLKMWYDFFPKAKIYGVDINEATYLNNERVTTYVADQSRKEDLDAFLEACGENEFDIIIDDGSHKPEHQQLTFSHLFKYLKSGGLYFIEDLFDNGLGDKARGRASSSEILNTRKVLRNFIQQGSFLAPNALLDENYLLRHIAYLRFHAPRIRFKKIPNPNNPRQRNIILAYETDQEQLCVIRKK